MKGVSSPTVTLLEHILSTKTYKPPPAAPITRWIPPTEPNSYTPFSYHRLLEPH